MKVLFTADLHIKLGQKSVPVDWAKDRYAKLFKSICDVVANEKIELMVLGGDIFDKLPSMDELELYFDLVMRIRCPTIIYPGNHEALKKNTTFLTSLKEVTTNLNDRVTIVDDFKSVDNMDFIPYNKLREPWPEFTGNVLFTHVRGEIPPHVKPEIDLDRLKQWDVVLAGDLHSYANSQLNILYPGSPLTTSFHRNNVDTGIIIFDNNTLAHSWIKLELPQLIRKTIQAGEPMPQTDYDHTVYQVEGDMSSLAQMEESGLLDKKVVRRSSDTTLILDPDMTIAQELEEYLRYVLELPDSTVVEVLKDFNNE